MGTEKGLFKDDVDRLSVGHQEISMWLLENAEEIVRRVFFDRPAGGVRVGLETLISNNKFIIGFADVILEYVTDCGSRECVLIEVKSSLSDFGACLRQLRTYREYLPAVTKSCVVHADERYEPFGDNDGKMRLYFSSQGVYVVDVNSGFFNPNYCALPSGRREVTIDFAEPHGYDFEVDLSGIGFNERGEEEETQIYIFRELDFIDPFCELVGISPAEWYFDWSLARFRELGGMKLLVDVHHCPDSSGYADKQYLALHVPDLSRSLDLLKWP